MYEFSLMAILDVVLQSVLPLNTFNLKYNFRVCPDRRHKLNSSSSL